MRARGTVRYRIKPAGSRQRKKGVGDTDRHALREIKQRGVHVTSGEEESIQACLYHIRGCFFFFVYAPAMI